MVMPLLGAKQSVHNNTVLETRTSATCWAQFVRQRLHITIKHQEHHTLYYNSACR